jgi:flagellar export protein FliJ
MMELGRIAQSLSRSEERHRRIEAEMQADTDRYRQHTRQGLTVEALLEWQARLDGQQAALRQVRIDMEQTALSWERTNHLLVESSQECKVFDRIIERRKAAARADRVRQEQRTTDEAASRRHLSR